MHFSTVATIFGLVAVTIAAPGAPSGGPPGGVSSGHHQGSESVCFCCPGEESDPEFGNCSRLAEDNTCQAEWTVFCCDIREGECSSVAEFEEVRSGGLLDLGKTVKNLIGVKIL